MIRYVTKKMIIVGLFVMVLGASIIPAIGGSLSPQKNTLCVTLDEAQTIAQAKLNQMDRTDLALTDYSIIQNQRNILCYLFELAPQGYIVVSASRDLIPVLAYSFTSSFGSLDYKTNPLLRMVTTDLQYQIDHSASLPLEVKQHRKQEWTTLQSDLQGLRFEQWPPEGSTPTGGWVLTRWTQNAPYNNFCPFLNGQRSVAGCPAVAMAQILNYHETTRDTQFTDADDYYHAYAGNNFWIDNECH